MEFLCSFLKRHFVGKTSSSVTKCWLFSQALQVGAFLLPCYTPRHLPFCVGKEEWETENKAWFWNQVLKSREHCCASFDFVCLTGGWTTANTGGNGTVIRTSCMLTRTETLHFHTVEALLMSRKSFCPMR